MKTISTCVALVLMLSLNGLVRASSNPEALEADSLYADYLSYIQSLDSIDEITDADKSMWVSRFEQAVADWSDPGRRYAARNVIIALHNARQDWDLSLAAIDEAISSTDSDEYLFEWQYDRWTVLHRIDQQEGAGQGASKILAPIKIARDNAIATFIREYNVTSIDGRPLNGVAKFIALSSDAARDRSLPIDKRVEIGAMLLKISSVYQDQYSISPLAIANYAGRLSGLLIEKSPEEAAEVIQKIDSGEEKLLAVVLSLQIAREETTSSLKINRFLWVIRDQFDSDTDWLNIAVRHVQNVFLSARTNKVELISGIAAEQLDGVPSIDLLNMLEPSVSQMLADGYGQIVRTRQSQSAKESFSILQNALYTLADLLELMGDRDNAEAYRAQTNPEKLKHLID